MDIVIVSSFEKKIYILDVAWKAESHARNMRAHSRLKHAGAFALETCGRIRIANVEFSYEHAACKR